jgi:hypothetical protein
MAYRVKFFDNEKGDSDLISIEHTLYPVFPILQKQQGVVTFLLHRPLGAVDLFLLRINRMDRLCWDVFGHRTHHAMKVLRR